VSIEEEYNLFSEYKKTLDPIIKEKIINSNLRFAISVAKKYWNNSNDQVLMDLIQEASMGLMEAVELFDISTGFKFISYAVWYCRKNCISYLDSKKIIRIPSNKLSMINMLNKIQSDNISSGGEELTREELTKKLKNRLKERKSNSALSMVDSGVTEYLSGINYETSSLDDVIPNSDSDTKVYETIEYKDDNILNFIKEDYLEKILSKLSVKDRKMIETIYKIKEHSPENAFDKLNKLNNNKLHYKNLIIKKLQRIVKNELI
jgi:RNA polymerase primary sigma factor